MCSKPLTLDDLSKLHQSEKLRHEHRRYTQAQRKHREMVARGKVCSICHRPASWSPCCSRCAELARQRMERPIEVDGKRQSVTKWARELGLHQSTVSWRLKEWKDPKKAVTKPAQRGGPTPQLITHDGVSLTRKDWAARLGTDKNAFRWRLQTYGVANACSPESYTKKNKACTKAYQMVSNTQTEGIHDVG